MMAASQTRVAPPPPPPPTMLAPAADGYAVEEPEEEEERKSRVGLAVLVTAIIVLVLGGAAYALYQLLTPEAPQQQTATVPALLDFTEKQATEQLTAHQLKVEVKTVNGKDDDTKLTVIDQKPKGGEVVPINSTVTITVNVGPKMGKVPGELVGKDLDEVKNELADAGFTNIDTKAAKEEKPDAQEDEVLSISPKSGTSVALNAKITVTYATGKSPVPNFVGTLESRARDLARENGFDSVEVATEPSTETAPGIVIRQNPPKGKVVSRTTKIRLVVTAVVPPPTTASPPPSGGTPSGSGTPSGTPS
jgi:serine/threonine-protein kinase